MNIDDDRNPMHYTGLGRGDDLEVESKKLQQQPSRRPTMAYSIVNEEEAKRRHGGTATAKLAATPAETGPVPNTTVQSIISQITERDIAAWMAIPNSIRTMMLTAPEKFVLIPNPVYPNDIPLFSYGGMVFKWNGAESWMLSDYREITTPIRKSV